MHWNDRLRRLAAQQAGVIGRHQMTSVGCDNGHWWRVRRDPEWELITDRVLRVVGAPEDDRQRVFAGLVDAGPRALIHGPTALAWYKTPTFDLARIELLRPRGTTSTASPLPGVHVHRVRRLDECDVRILHGARVASPVRALFSEASRYGNPADHDYGVSRIGWIADRLHQRRLLGFDELAAELRRLRRRGLSGVTVLDAVSRARPPGSRPTESRLEDRLEELAAEIPSLVLDRQHVVGGTRPIGRVDHRALDLPLVIETNSLEFHALLSDQLADEDRYRALVHAGFTVLAVWEDDLWRRPGCVVDGLRAGRDHARRGEPVVLHTPGCPWPEDPSRRIVGSRGPDLRG